MLFEKMENIRKPAWCAARNAGFNENQLPLIKTTFNAPHIGHRTLLTAGIGESVLAEMIQQWEENYLLL